MTKLMLIYFPFSGDVASKLCYQASQLWPGCYAGWIPTGLLISDEPYGKDPRLAADMASQVLEPKLEAPV